MESTEKPKRSRAATATKPPAKRKAKTPTVSPEIRQKMIADAAYYRAQNSGEGELANWLAAEVEIDEMLRKGDISG